MIANTADDDEFWGMLVCPDLDAVMYRFAGLFNDRDGYGVKGDTFHVLEMLERAGEPVWFRIGDQDFATHLLRAQMLRSGRTLTETTVELCRRFGVEDDVLPMSDDPVRTRFDTDAGELSFQEFFVRERLQPRLRGISFAGIDSARPSARVASALERADLVVIGPSNPLISIAPILKLVGDHIDCARTVAVTPIVRGAALKGPTVEMMRALGYEPSPEAVAGIYSKLAGTFVLDERDRDAAPAIEGLGYRTVVTDTVMRDGGGALARAILGHV